MVATSDEVTKCSVVGELNEVFGGSGWLGAFHGGSRGGGGF